MKNFLVVVILVLHTVTLAFLALSVRNLVEAIQIRGLSVTEFKEPAGDYFYLGIIYISPLTASRDLSTLILAGPRETRT